MADWKEMSLDNRRAAQVLLSTGLWRSSVTRAYYAAYCGICSVLADKITFGHGGNNPAHNDLPTLVLHNISFLPEWKRKQVQSAFRRLWKARVDADYIPAAFVNRAVAVTALRDASRILLVLEINDD